MIDTTNFTKITPVSEIRKGIKQIPKKGGVYKQYVDKKGLEYLDGVHPTTREIASNGTEVYLLYIGLSKDLLDRFKWHLGTTNTSHKSILGGWLSTLRFSYMANHNEIKCLSEQNKLDKFMDEHIYIQYMITEDFKAIEKQLIEANDLPLNVKGNLHTFVQTNSLRRTAIMEKYIKENTNSDSAAKPTNIKTHSKPKIGEEELRKYAQEAEKEGIKNKSRFLKWFRGVKKQKAQQVRLYKAWDERSS